MSFFISSSDVRYFLCGIGSVVSHKKVSREMSYLDTIYKKKDFKS